MLDSSTSEPCGRSFLADRTAFQLGKEEASHQEFKRQPRSAGLESTQGKSGEGPLAL